MKEKASERLDISKYLKYLDEDGWSELIDERWKEKVRQTLLAKFPDMRDEEWIQIFEVVFW